MSFILIIKVLSISSRQRRWLELIKDYDVGINYQPGKANVVADALNRTSYCNDLMLQQNQPPLHKEFARLNLEIVPHGYLNTLEVKSSLEDQIKVAQEQDAHLLNIKKDISSGTARGFTIDDKCTVYVSNHLVVPKKEDLKDRKSVV